MGTRPPSGEQLELAHGDQRAVVVEVGGGLRTYTVAGQDVLDGYGDDQMATAGRGQVLAPWPNRLEDGSYSFDSRTHQLPLNELEHANAIHGLVRWAAWGVREREPNRVVVEHVIHSQPGYPFTLELGIEYALGDTGLTVRTTATNAGAGPCPYGSGAHPYLTVGTATVDDVVLTVPARTWLRSDERGLPVGAEAVDGTELDYRAPRRIGSARLDHCFADLERDRAGRTVIVLAARDGERGANLWLDEGYRYVMIFTGDLPEIRRGGLAVEPMTCPPNAFRTGEGLLRLEPGASVTTSWGISSHIVD